MRKATIFLLAIAISCPMLISSAPAVTKDTQSSEAAEQILLRLLFQPVHDAIEAYYGAPRQYWRDKILRIRNVPNSPYYEVILQAETFYGPHNPPYGIETMTFYVKYGSVELKKFEHREDREEG
ncbi:MAG: DUF3888 domain-containing protein [Lawsonibacter sp.]|nr:DUF3888 domain-containing protein [Lawsonibacter sp.]